MDLNKIKLRKCSDSRVARLKNILDSCHISDGGVEEYANDLYKFVLDGKVPAQAIVKQIDEVVSGKTLFAIMQDLADVMDWPESLDESILEYIDNTAEEGQKDEAYQHVIESDKLSSEDKLIVADIIYAIANKS